MKLTATDRRSSRKVWPALSMALLFAGVCAAQPIFNSITGPCSSSCESATVAGSSISPPGSSYAAQFTSATARQAVDARIVVISGEQPGSDGSFNVAIFSDAGGLPGSPIGTAVAGLTAPPYPGGTVTATFSQPISLGAGTPYWLVLTPADASTYIGWILGGSSTVPAAGTASPSASGGWSASSFDTLQFAIDATAQPSPPVITTSSLPGGTVNVAYSQTLAASGGTPPYVGWTVVSGALPAGLTLNVSSGAISGTPVAAGTFPFSVTVKDSAGSVSVAQALSIGIVGAPAIAGLSPLSVIAGGPAFTLTINGSGFLPGATVQWNGSPLVTTYVNSNQLTAAVSAGMIAAAGSAGVTVVNPGGLTSNAAVFTINPPSIPTIGTLIPISAAAGGPAFTLTVNGSGFLAGAKVQWNSSPLVTTYLNASQLTAAVPAGLIAAAGSASIQVANPGGQASNTVTFQINPPPAPSISALIPTTATAGGPDFTLIVNGANFLSGAVVHWNASPVATSYVNQNQLTALVPAGLIAVAGSASVTVVNPGGSASNAATFTIVPNTARLFVSPQNLTFTYQQGGSLPTPQTVSVFSSGAPLKYSVTTSANWLKAAAGTGQTPDNVTVSLPNLSNLPTCPGPASCTNTATLTVAPQGSPSAAALVNVTLTVTPAQPQLVVSPEYLTVSAAATGSSIQRQVQVFNTGGGTLNYTVTAAVLPWLTVSCGASGSVTFTNPASICITLNPSAVQAGLYHTLVTVNAGSGIQATVNVTLQVVQAEPLILLSPGAMEFNAVSGGQTPSAQTLTVFNIGTGTMDWSAQASGNWLQLSTNGCGSISQPVTGSAASGGPAGSLEVCVDPAQAVPGANYGQITVQAVNGAAGNSESIAVLLNVLPTGSPLPEVAVPTGLILEAAGGSSAPAGSVTLSNPNASAINFTTATVTGDGAAWLSVSPPSGSLVSQGTAQLQVKGTAGALAAGTYHGQVRVGFGDGSSQVINVILVVTTASGTTSQGASARERKVHPLASPPNCPGGEVLPPQFVNLSQQGFTVQAGTVQQLLVQVKDSCGNPITDGDVGATLSVVIYNSTTQATLETPNLVYSTAEALWQYGWTPTSTPSNNEVGPVGMYAVAGVGVGDNSTGNRSDIWTGTVTAASAGSAAQPVTVINAASPDIDNISQYNQVAAGSYIAIYGAMLADGTANPYPFPTQAQGTEVLLGGIPLLLDYVSPTQINALVPTTSQLPQNAPLPLKIQRDGTVSVQDLQVSVAAVQPAIYTLDGKQAAALIANTVDIAAPVASPWGGSRPAQAGVDYIEIYCNGLGPVTNQPKDGQQAGSDPLSWTVTMPTMTIGGVPATPIFWGLSPGSVALYQVNVQVPAGSQTGAAVPIVIQMGAVSSNTAYIAVQ